MNDTIQIRRLFLLLLSIFLIGILGYHFIEGWSLFDSLYMTVITLATIGYGETHPLSVEGRIFTMILILTGLGLIGYTITEITAFLVEGEMKGLLLRRRMKKLIDQLSDHYILCGVGRSGRYVLDELAQTGRKVVVIDNLKERIDKLVEAHILAIEGDATEDTVLQSAGIGRAAGLVTTLPNDRDNLFVVITARGLNPKLRIISKIQEVSARDKFIRSGADGTVSSGFIGGLRMASELVRPATVSFLDTMLRRSDHLRIEDLPLGETSHFIGETLEESKLNEKANVLILSLKRNGEFQFNPEASTVLKVDDVLVVMGAPSEVERARKIISG